ncbi:hypothetical protein HK098_003527 [Nowakowskiella sp. JEL0407]|nr:hypothetical protein HK098_003527 [Nowakowskiella sp. JEL0407]
MDDVKEVSFTRQIDIDFAVAAESVSKLLTNENFSTISEIQLRPEYIESSLNAMEASKSLKVLSVDISVLDQDSLFLFSRLFTNNWASDQF